MKKATKQLVESIQLENNDKVIDALKDNNFIIGVKKRLSTYTTIISLPKPDSQFISDCEVFEIQTYATEQSARKLAKEIRLMVEELNRFPLLRRGGAFNVNLYNNYLYSFLLKFSNWFYGPSLLKCQMDYFKIGYGNNCFKNTSLSPLKLIEYLFMGV